MPLTHAGQAVSSTDLQKKTRELLDRVSGDKREHLVVMRDNKPAAVLMGTLRYEALMDELEDLRIEAVARARIATPHSSYMPQADMDAFVSSL